MNRQKSFENDKPTLYLVPTPIGNLSEMSPRAVEVLKSVDVIACEDTRTSGQLLKHFEIKNRLITYQNFNEDPAAKGIINLLSQGHNVALISDAGYPLISDPGQRVVSEASAMGFNVVPLSGPNAMLNALVASGLVVQPFLFAGFLPAGRTDCLKKLREYRSYPMTLIFYEAPHRIEKMMKNCLEVLGDRRCCIARELTKMHEEFLRGTIRELLPELAGLKGEMVVVIEGNRDDYSSDVDYGEILTMVNEAVAAGMTTSAAIRQIASETGVSKNKIYELVHQQES
ncbi:MAG: 16S rRNA (cytidine(1402)-2'-O)-methyltransferase [Solobacterium sp.]|nr:16S rRNA (cytidine(1402)-2'-O)-methyltransferase [Solobacterium sp.]MBQ6532747.1 16S rRNA (cytidine(1402)-2'-O)-methyltransferase [Solobacterium sp.]MBR0214897.1 16S rRNA (cytidine(1402)-2'-O)-methyltransferase [Solobacterium sp.]